jgi:hypothetical protein
MDFITHLPRTERGFDAIMVVGDRLSKMVHLMPNYTTANAPTVAELYFDGVFKHHGIPDEVVSDRNPKFTSAFWRSMMQVLGTKLTMSTSYHAQTDGQTERLNRTLGLVLRAYVAKARTDWDEWLTVAEFAINNSVSESTGQTPFYLNTGQHPTTPADRVLPDASAATAAADARLKTLDTVLQSVQRQLQTAQGRQAQHANRRRRKAPMYKVESVCGSALLRLALHSRQPTS